MKLEGRLERERVHYNEMAAKTAATDSLVMAADNVRRYRNPSPTTPYPLEYAFHLLGSLEGKTVVDLGCGDGLNTVILARLGAKVISVDISDKSLELTEARARANGVADAVRLVHSDAAVVPVGDGSADRVLCAAILHHVDCVATARQIQRMLKPGGIAVFSEPLAGPEVLQSLKNALPRNPSNTDDEAPLTMQQVAAVSAAIGEAGRGRVFWLTTRLVYRARLSSWTILKAAHHLDAWLVRSVPFARHFASPLVWEARKLPSRG